MFQISRLARHGLPASLVLVSVLASACGRDVEGPPGKDPSDPSDPKIGSTSFISAQPGSAGRGGLEGGDGDVISGAGGSTSAPTDGGAEGPPVADDPGRAIAEADIIKLDGSKLYALSRYSGLSIIDIKNPSKLALLGNYKASGTPFEMYVEGERVYVMYNGYGSYLYDEEAETYRYEVVSRIEAIDVSNARSPRLLGAHDVPGELSDSRKVGDVLYLVAYENGYCWGCLANTPNTNVVSFNVSNPDEFALIDQLRIGAEEGAYYGKRSIAVTEKRIYISGQDWGGEDHGVADVVDISDPAGDLKLGARFRLAGPVQSRWQMDEHGGIFRTVTQPGSAWGSTEAPPVIETFEVVSSNEVNKLGSLEVTLPRPEALRSARFDGDRAFAITFERTDPLFTFDLSDPAAPRQLGELEIPGWVYHMEPRGDRIYALGFEDGNVDGALHVSLFDIAELSEPKQLARVNFGGRWANFAEDQDRIHKAFNIMSDEGLILVPYAGWDYDEGQSECSYGRYESGIQLVDMTEDSLELRGVAPQVGEARRGFMAEGALFAVSDNAVQTFDISDRDEPQALDMLETARNIATTRVMGDTMLRFGSDWWTGRTVLDFVSLADVDVAEPLGELDLSAVTPTDDTCEKQAYWEGSVYVHGDYAYVPQRIYSSVASPDGKSYRQYLRFYVVDLSDRSAPQVVRAFSVAADDGGEGILGITLTDSALLVGRTKGYYRYDDQGNPAETPTFSYDVFSLSDPARPKLVSTLEVPHALSGGGFGYNISGCVVDVGFGFWRGYGYGGQVLVSGDIVASQHAVPLEDGSGRVRYYLDRIDVSDPENPKLLPEVNIPGNVVDFDAGAGRIVTIDHDIRSTQPGPRGCDYGWLESGVCTRYIRSLNTLELSGDVATLRSRLEIDGEDERGHFGAGQIAVGGDRIFVQRTTQTGDGYDQEMQIFALSGSARLSDLGSVELERNGWGSLYARGGRGFFHTSGRMLEIDARDPDELKTKTHDTGSYYCNSFEVTDTHAYCARGYEGVWQMELRP